MTRRLAYNSLEKEGCLRAVRGGNANPKIKTAKRALTKSFKLLIS